MDPDREQELLRILCLLMTYFGAIAGPEDFDEIEGWGPIQRWIWSQVYTCLESGEYGDWTPFNGLPFPQDTTPLIAVEDLENLTEILGEEISNHVLGIIIPRWGAFLIREVVNEDLLSHALTDVGLETLQRNFVIELWNNIAAPG